MPIVLSTRTALLFATLAGGVWIWLSLLVSGAVALALFRGLPVDAILGNLLWSNLTTPELLALPLFILMAEVLLHSRLSETLFRGIAPWTTRLPGRLLHVNIIACTVFASISGSSAATTVTVGRMTLKELISRGYDRNMAIGSLAGAGTLGFLIPPSTAMIIYALLANVSVIQLFAAGIFPGLILAAMFMLYVAARALLNPAIVPAADDNATWRERFEGLRQLGPVGLLIVSVLGSLYAGIATPTEAAAIGVLGAFILVAVQGKLSLVVARSALVAAMRTTSMIGLIVAAAAFLSVALGYLGIPRWVASTVAGWDLSPYALIAVLVVAYAILGCFLDGISLTVMTLPITLPLVVAAGFDAIWFGIFIVICVEMAQLTPPVGFNLLVIQGLTGEPLRRVAVASFPFFLILTSIVVVLVLFPGIVSLGPALIR